ncbi:protein ATP6V1FNB [Spea bombifrons]|uniref:protein ATP6V1FNB n=1 Tax=Spea bombifrons TaxID=233779 RepID=UPI00234BD176|nr:protein ATP6V1FNB [Spea bombifrons]
MSQWLNLTTQKQDFMKESYDKEVMTRIRWHLQYGQSFRNRSQPRKKPRAEHHIMFPAINDTRLRASEDHKRPTIIDERGKDLQDRSERAQSQLPTIIDNDMRPVSAKTLSLLYHGTSKEEEGRHRYLRLRNSKKPEEKYYYPVTSNWAYGWQMGKIEDSQPPIFRRCRIVNDTFYRKNGITSEVNSRDVAF